MSAVELLSAFDLAVVDTDEKCNVFFNSSNEKKGRLDLFWCLAKCFLVVFSFLIPSMQYSLVKMPILNCRLQTTALGF